MNRILKNRNLAFAVILLVTGVISTIAKEKIGNIYPITELVIRDPYVFADSKTQTYYIQASDNAKGLKVYRSKDLKNWEYAGKSFVPSSDFWGVSDFWAPDMFERNGKYYVIATFSAKEKTIKTVRGIEPLRGSSVLVADKPEGPYKPLVNAPLTPKDMMCLDATLYEEDGKLWLLYCHEWLQISDGAMLAQEVSQDLTKTIGEPIVLFKASSAPWGGNSKTKVTDAPVVNRAPDGTLYMTWSTFGKDGQYHIGFATSSNGKLLGKWKQSLRPLNSDDGGHAMVFKTFDGKTMISYHAPNSYPSRPTIRTFEVKGESAEIGK